MSSIKTGMGRTTAEPYPVHYQTVGRGKPDKVFRPLVYVCCPFRGDVEKNLERTRAFCRFALDQGQIPLAPTLMYPQFMNDDDRDERDLAMFMDIILMGKCQEVWVLYDRISEGMRTEIDKANRRRQKVRYFDGNFKEVFPE